MATIWDGDGAVELRSSLCVQPQCEVSHRAYPDIRPSRGDVLEDGREYLLDIAGVGFGMEP